MKGVNKRVICKFQKAMRKKTEWFYLELWEGIFKVHQVLEHKNVGGFQTQNGRMGNYQPLLLCTWLRSK